METLSKKNKRTEDKESETNGGDSHMSESNAVDDLPLAKSNDYQHLVESNKSEDGKQGKKKNKKKKTSEESKDKEYKELKSNECEDDNQGKKIKKKQMLIEGNTPKECNDFRSNVDEDGKQDKKVKKKKKKLSEECIHKEFESNECEDDNQGKMKKKQKLIEGNTLKEGNDFRSNGDEDGKQDKKMKKKKKLNEESNHTEYNERNSNECEDDNQGKKMKKKQKLIEGNFGSNGGEDGEQDKKMKKKKLSEESKHKERNEFKSNGCEDDQGKKMKKKRKLVEGNTLNECNDSRSNECEDGEQDKMKKKKKKLSEESKHKERNEFKSNECEDDQGKKMKKKRKLMEGNTLNECNDSRSNECEDGEQDKKMKKKKKKPSEESKHKESSEFKSNEGKHKRVTFSDEVETFCCDGLVRGKRFSPEEDETLKASVFAYIDSHGLGEEGLDKVLHARLHSEVRGCWKEIAQALPHRPLYSVYQRAHALLENVGRCKWTPDELEFIRKSYEQHGPDWRLIADALGKSRDQVKDLWRRLKYKKARHGHWSQEEYQTLFNLVNMDLRARSLEPFRKSQHGMLRDNICWEAIGHKLETRNSAYCCKKWYEELTSTMVARGEWCDTDDFRLIDALYTLDACCMEEVEWDELLEHRSGDACRKRWEQMVQHLGEHARKPFMEQVEVLTKRFCPDLLEARETFDNKPVTC
ncbi:RNA polymerase I termination factor-like isoform X1 [Trifolium pratense]|nr:RNA polymerase I termination factor-like isoform X1 [Trifolium pratense]